MAENFSDTPAHDAGHFCEPVGDPRKPAKAKLGRRAVDAALAVREPGKRSRLWFTEPAGLFLNVTPNGSGAYYRQVFATNLRRSRQAKGLSQEGLAFKAGINRSYISKLETGATWAGLEVICKIAKVLLVEPSDLLARPPRGRRGSSHS